MAERIPGTETSKKGKFNPFPGLRPFRPEESDLFFGREKQSEDALTRLLDNRFLTVIGSSGSGKSSLVYCGLIPKIADMRTGHMQNWQVISMQPGNDPLGNLGDGLADALMAEKQIAPDRKIIDGIIRNEENGLINAVNKLKINNENRLLLFIDQFEELFRYHSAAKPGVSDLDTRIFVSLLTNAVKDPASGISVIITMRSDFIGECAHFRGLTELINNSTYLVPQMEEDNYRRAISGPVAYAGAKIDHNLVELLISEIGERTDQLPVLQHSLMRTWDHWQTQSGPGRPVSISDYDAIGRMAEAMSRHANEAFEELGGREQEICESLFKTITEKTADNKGVRRPGRIDTIAEIARCSVSELVKVINTFRSEGRSFIIPSDDTILTGDTIIDISHESLIRLWDRLQEWVDEEAESVQMYIRLSESAAMFQEGKTSLWNQPDLQLAINWRKKNKPSLAWAERFNPAFERTMVYLRTSEKEYLVGEENKIRAQKRQLRRSRVMSAILGTAAVISVFFMLFAFVKQLETEKNRQKAEEQVQLATVQKLRAEEIAAEAKLQEGNAIADAVKARGSAMEAIRLRELSDRNAGIAEMEMNRALARADSASMVAEEARRQRMLSIAKYMALRSLDLGPGSDLKELLAYQAYLFNERNDGVDNDPDIYMGLYDVAKLHSGLNYKTFEGHSAMVNSIAFLPGSQSFFTTGDDDRVLRWNVRDADQAPAAVFKGDRNIEVMTVSDDGKLLACGTGESVIMIIPLQSAETMYELKGHSGSIRSLVFTYGNKRLVSSGDDGQVILWDIENRKPTQLLSSGEAVNSLDVSGKGEYLLAASESGQVYTWNLDNNAILNTVNSGNGPASIVKFRDDNSYVIGYLSGLIEFMAVGESGSSMSVNAHSAGITDVCFNKPLQQMASSSMDGSVKIWACNEPDRLPVSLEDNGGAVMALAFSPDGKFLVSGTEGRNGGQSIAARPAHADYIAEGMCNVINRNFTTEEWWRYVDRNIEYEQTCTSAGLNIQFNKKKGD